MSKKKLMAVISMALIAVSMSACAKIKITIEDDKKENVKEEVKEEEKTDVKDVDKEVEEDTEGEKEESKNNTKEETKQEENSDESKFFTGMSYNEIPTVDLNGDGIKDTISITTEDDCTYDVKINEGLEGEATEMYGPAVNMYNAYIVDLDKNDNYKELALDWFMRGDNGSSDKLLSIYRYDGKKVEMVDEVFGTVDPKTGEIIKEK